jgi:flagellar FliL protein
MYNKVPVSLMKKSLWTIFLSTLLTISSMTQTAIAAGGGGSSGDPEGIVYMDIKPAFVVNIDDPESNIRYLQVSVSLKLDKGKYEEKVKKHLPMIKHHLVLLLSSLTFSEIRSSEGKIKLSERALKTIQAALKEKTGQKLVSAVFLPSIVGQ